MKRKDSKLKPQKGHQPVNAAKLEVHTTQKKKKGKQRKEDKSSKG